MGAPLGELEGAGFLEGDVPAGGAVARTEGDEGRDGSDPLAVGAEGGDELVAGTVVHSVEVVEALGVGGCGEDVLAEGREGDGGVGCGFSVGEADESFDGGAVGGLEVGDGGVGVGGGEVGGDRDLVLGVLGVDGELDAGGDGEVESALGVGGGFGAGGLCVFEEVHEAGVGVVGGVEPDAGAREGLAAGVEETAGD